MNNELKELLQTKVPLRFHEDGNFRILMVSDIHGGVGYDSERTIAAMQTMIDGTKPDLVLLGGDIAGPGYIHIETQEQLKTFLDGFTSPMEKAGIPWAHVYGNHDNNYGLDNADHQPVYESYPHCVSKAGPEDVSGVGNYVLPIYDAKGENILFNVFGLDSHRGLSQFKEAYGLDPETKFFHLNGNNTNGDDCIHIDQVVWYYQTSKALEAYAGKKIPALMYMHIPLPEHDLVSLHRDACKYQGAQGEDVACSPLNSGLFAACLQRGDVKGIFCGHDHENNFCGTYCGIKLGYDGYLSYHASQTHALRGGRIFDLHADNPAQFETRTVCLYDLIAEKSDC